MILFLIFGSVLLLYFGLVFIYLYGNIIEETKTTLPEPTSYTKDFMESAEKRIDKDLVLSKELFSPKKEPEPEVPYIIDEPLDETDIKCIKDFLKKKDSQFYVVLDKTKDKQVMIKVIYSSNDKCFLCSETYKNKSFAKKKALLLANKLDTVLLMEI